MTSVSGRTQTFCQPGGRTSFCHVAYGCLFEKQAKIRLIQLADQQGTAELLRYVL